MKKTSCIIQVFDFHHFSSPGSSDPEGTVFEGKLLASENELNDRIQKYGSNSLPCRLISGDDELLKIELSTEIRESLPVYLRGNKHYLTHTSVPKSLKALINKKGLFLVLLD